MVGWTEFGKKRSHGVDSTRLVEDERRLQERNIICDCGKVMYQKDRDESPCFIFVEYECTCGLKREMIVDKRKDM